MREGIELRFGEEVVVQDGAGEGGVREAVVNGEERVEIQTKVGDVAFKCHCRGCSWLFHECGVSGWHVG